MGMQDFPPITDAGEMSLANERTSLLNDSPNNGFCGRLRQTWPLLCIVLTVLLERTAYYGILANLVLFLNDELGFTRDQTVISLFLFTGTAWLFSTIGGLIGDSYSGRFKAILFSLVIYIIGAIILDIVALFHKALSSQSHPIMVVVVVFSYICLSFGEGAFKANTSAFGGEQLINHDAETYRRFFSWFYWAINIGSFIGFSLLAWVQIKINFKVGYFIPIGCLVAAFIIFLIPNSKYTIYPLSSNVFKKVFGIVREAFSLRKAKSTSRCPGLEEVMPIRSWLDRAMCKYGGSYLDSEVLEVKNLLRIKIIFATLIPYWLIYFQMNSTFLIQGLHMDLELIKSNSTEGFKDVPAAWLSLADVTVVILLIPLMDKVIYPWFRRKGWEPSLISRISLGFLFATASMFTAGIVEYQRQQNLKNYPSNIQEINNKQYIAADMSIFYQVPQYALIGISEVLASVGCLEFAYREAPESMHGFVMGLFYLIGSVGNLLGAGLYAFSTHALNWTCNTKPTSADLGHLDYYFYLLGGILFVTWLIFIVFSAPLRYKSDTSLSRTKYSSLISSDASDSSISHRYTSVVT